MQEVTITFVGGKATIKVNGIKGGDCKNVTKALEKALGVTTKSTPTPEFYERAKQSQSTGR